MGFGSETFEQLYHPIEERVASSNILIEVWQPQRHWPGNCFILERNWGNSLFSPLSCSQGGGRSIHVQKCLATIYQRSKWKVFSLFLDFSIAASLLLSFNLKGPFLQEEREEGKGILFVSSSFIHDLLPPWICKIQAMLSRPVPQTKRAVDRWLSSYQAVVEATNSYVRMPAFKKSPSVKSCGRDKSRNSRQSFKSFSS